MTEKRFGPFQQAANKLLEWIIEHRVPNSAEIQLDGQLGPEWVKAFDTIFADPNLRHKFNYGILRYVRDSVSPLIGRWSFVGNIGQNDGHHQFLGLIQRLTRKEAELNVVDWRPQACALQAELKRLTDWRKRGELLDWGQKLTTS